MQKEQGVCRGYSSFFLTVWPVLLGMVAFFIAGGSGMLSPGNVGWLGKGDLAQSYLGWALYRESPWTFPLGANPNYGLEIHSSIYYSDSIPFLAIFFKLISSILPGTFQYFGIWVLLCFALQGYFAWRLIGLISKDFWLRSAGLVFFLLAPMMIARLAGHMALVGHWIVLAALYLYLRPGRRGVRQCLEWALLIALAIGVHAYLFVMVIACWLADLLARGLECRNLRAYFLGVGEIFFVGMFVMFFAWQYGFFMVPASGMSAGGFGYYKMNLLSPVDGKGWSAFGLAFPRGPGEYEGFNYLGIGSLILMGASVFLLARVWKLVAPNKRWRIISLIFMSMGLTALAVTFNVGFGEKQIQLNFPAGIKEMLLHSSLQSTGRLFWPVAYLLWLGSIAIISRGMPRRWAVALIIVASMVQVLDLQPGLAQVRAGNLARLTAKLPGDLHSPFWGMAGERYRKIRGIPLGGSSPGWESAAFLAQKYKMSTDLVQVARLDWKKAIVVRALETETLLKGLPDSDTLYLIQDPSALAMVQLALVNPADALFDLDGRQVMAPSWGKVLPYGAIDLRTPDHLAASPYRLPLKIQFAGNKLAQQLLGAGWWGVGGEGFPEAEVGAGEAHLYVPADTQKNLKIHMTLACSSLPRGVKLELRIDDANLSEFLISSGHDECAFDARLPPIAGGGNFRLLKLRLSGHPPVTRKERKQRVPLHTIEVVLED